MLSHKTTVLVVSTDEAWRDCCSRAFLAEECEVTVAHGGLEGLALLQKSFFDIIVADDSCPDMAIFEFLFNARDIARNGPIVLLGGDGLEQFDYVWRSRNVSYAGAKNGLLMEIPSCVKQARSPSKGNTPPR